MLTNLLKKIVVAVILTTALSAAAERAPSAAESRAQGAIVGTWFVRVPGGGGAQDFYAYQTFGTNGTFTETSSLLGTLPEGPAHGAWKAGADGKIALTFELFSFDAAGTAVGRVRVRCLIDVGGNTFHADGKVDILSLEGEVLAEAVASGPFEGTRVQTLPL